MPFIFGLNGFISFIGGKKKKLYFKTEGMILSLRPVVDLNMYLHVLGELLTR